MEVLPRAPPKILKGQERVNTPWDFLNSVFAKYKPDTERILVDCFQFDWERVRIEKLLKNDEPTIFSVKQFLQLNYKYIREVYKIYSGESPQGRLPCIGATTFNLLIQQCPDLVDGYNLKSSDVDLEYVASNSLRADYTNFPDRVLVRMKFLEAVVRLALSRYYKSKICNSAFEAIQKAFQEHFIPAWEQYDCH